MEIMQWLNVVLTLGGFVTVYVRIAERLTRLEANNKHIMAKLKMGIRDGD